MHADCVGEYVKIGAEGETMFDTICAISTANAMGAISIIRISGPDTFPVISKLTKKDFSQFAGNTIHYANIYEQDDVVDEVLVSVFVAPHSFTGEHSVEINCHGGIYITRKVLSLCLSAGCRLANRGEFTMRAYLNGKLDLTQAEGIHDLITARDELNAKASARALKGSVQRILNPLIEEIVQIIANIEVNIDYPEYDDVHIVTDQEVLPKMHHWLNTMQKLIQTSKDASVLKDGIDTVIIGKPNVGKSSLLNAFLEYDKAIVTDIEGTTRDLVEGTVHFGDLVLNLIDTAGIRESEDVVEKIGIERSKEAIQKADIVIFVLDGGPLNEQEEELLKYTENKQRIVVYNKKDIHHKEDVLSISALNHDIQPLKDAILQLYEKEMLSMQSDIFQNERQIGLAQVAYDHMQDACQALQQGYELDLVTIDIEKAWHSLKEMIGEVGKEDLLDEIFSRFCLGK